MRAALAHFDAPVEAGTLAALFGRRSKKRVADVTGLLDTLVALGQARRSEDGRYAGV